MFADAIRAPAYLAAIARGVPAGAVVVEIGTGVGYFAVAACAAGARRVYAIEVNPAIELGPALAADNNCADRITFIRADSRRVTLPEPGDVLLTDLRGVLPLFSEHIPTIVDARSRLLRPGAALIPRRDTLWAAPAAAPESWRIDHLEGGEAPHGINRRAVTARVRSNFCQCYFRAESLAADGVRWAVLDYATIESPDVSGRAGWTFARDGVADGLALWFESDLGFGAGLSNSPVAERLLYGQAFFPFERSLRVRAGDHLAAELRAVLVNGEYVWGWDSTLTPAASPSAPVAFRQSNLAAHVESLENLRALGAGRGEPRPAQDGERSIPSPHTPFTA